MFSLFQFWPEDQAEKSRLPAGHLRLQRPAAPPAADQQQGDGEEGTSGQDKRNRLRPPPPPGPAGQRRNRDGTGRRSRWSTLQGQEVVHGGLEGPERVGPGGLEEMLLDWGSVPLQRPPSRTRARLKSHVFNVTVCLLAAEGPDCFTALCHRCEPEAATLDGGWMYELFPSAIYTVCGA